MKNNELQEVKPIYIHDARYSSNDEISLIDLAKILIKRKKLISIIIICFLIAGVIAALAIPQKYTYSTSIEIGSQILNGSIEAFEPPETLLAKLQHSYIPQVLTEQRLTDSENKRTYRIKANIPKNSTIIVIEVKETEDKADLMKTLLSSITQNAINDHKRIFESVKLNLQSQLKIANTKLANLGSNTDNQAEKYRLQSSIEGLSTQLTNLRNTRTVVPTIRSLQPTGVSRRLIAIMAGIAGLFTAVFAAFFAEFAAKVREEDQ